MTAAVGAAAALLVLAPASAGASTPRSPIALAATPARVTLVGSARTEVRITNSGTKPVELEVGRAGFALDLRGRPKIVPRGRAAAASWLAVHPQRLSLQPRSNGTLTVSSAVPRRARAGDHGALILLTSRPIRGARVAVRMRLGVIVVVRAPGQVSHRVELRRLRVRRQKSSRMLELLVANQGNVAEVLQRGRVTITIIRNRRVLATLRPAARELLPWTTGIVQARYKGPSRGLFTAVAEVALGDGRTTRRTFRLRL
jgi:hypothetical protein